MLGASALGQVATANAASNRDLEEYEECLTDIDLNHNIDISIELIKYCCEQSGGVWQGEDGPVDK